MNVYEAVVYIDESNDIDHMTIRLRARDRQSAREKAETIARYAFPDTPTEVEIIWKEEIDE